ncbi:Aspartate aminotransferase, cytoplasmic [Lachnellula subtilissima]|uniref:Aspartate aminotransferase, cytoplasmic n=1 Tax=Lachnellula subtilissima TaxID=602034 RepID=A0A8H8RFZ7_9HELO|nr:Aspartate aminotransferase, cytoplasmic [Lachnellula subtilissima]
MVSIQDSSPSPSFFENAQYIPVDAIFQVMKDFLADPDPKKVNLGPGTYRDENGKPWILPSVQLATTLVANCGHEYLPILGSQVFREEAVKLVFNGTKPYSEGRIASCQALSGTGALYLAGSVLRKVDPTPKAVYITNPTWTNHDLLFSSLGFDVKYLPYYKDKTFDFEGYMSGLVTAPAGSIIILHSCAHNPTGCDPSKEQWKKIASVIQDRHLFPIFDSAYLGFNSGSVNEDAWAIKYFVDELGLEASICLSFAKSMGLYGILSLFPTNVMEL